MRSFVSLVGVVLGASSLVSGCKPRAFNDGAENQTILGEDDRILINKNKSNIPKEYAALADAVGIMKKQKISLPGGVTKRFCTAFHIGGGIVMTAGHCLVGEDRTFNPAPILKEVSAKNTVWYIDFNDVENGKIQRSQIIKVIYAQNNSHGDFAILEINNPPKVSLKVNRGARPPVGAKISIISGGENKTLMWSNFCLVRPEPPASDEYSGPWPLRKNFDFTCDTKKVSSGGPLILDQDKSVIGINYYGDINYAGYRGPTEPGVSYDDLGDGINQAIFMDVALRLLPKQYESRLAK